MPSGHSSFGGLYVEGSIRSVMNRFKARIATGSPPVAPARHLTSQGWWQTRAQMEGKGLGSRMTR